MTPAVLDMEADGIVALGPFRRRGAPRESGRVSTACFTLDQGALEFRQRAGGDRAPVQGV